MRLIFPLVLAAAGLFPHDPALAENPVVVELFTSQGCSSCPPADELLGELAGRDGVIALSLHVDYWDYIGWEDTFASPAYTQRQRDYASTAGSTVVYTPQMVIGGVDHIVGYSPMNVIDLIGAHHAAPDTVEITVSRDGTAYIVRAEARMDPPRPKMIVQLVSYSPEERVSIRRGENEGRNAVYHNVVTSWQVVAEWDGATAFQSRVEPQSDQPLVVIVQRSGHGAILASAQLKD